MRNYEVRKSWDGTVVSAFPAADKDAAKTLIANNPSLLSSDACRLYRLANEVDGPEKHVWNYPAAGDQYPVAVYRGLGSEDEDF